jgi:hypothetical protein
MIASNFFELTLSDLMGFAITLIGIWLVVQQLHEAKLGSQMEGILTLQDHWERIIEDRTLLWEMTIQSNTWNLLSAKEAYRTIFGNKKMTDSFMRVANFFDGIGMLVLAKALDKELAYRGYCLVLSPLFDKFEKVILLDRKVQKNPRIFENWEWMRREFGKMDSQNGKYLNRKI